MGITTQTIDKLEIIIPPKQEFMARFTRYEPASRDHTSIIAFKECARLYFYKMVLGFTDKITPPFFVFGKAYHTFWEHLIKSDGNFMEAVERAIASYGQIGPPAGSKFEFLTLERLLKSCKVAYEFYKREQKRGFIKILGAEIPFEVILADGVTRRGGKLDEPIEWGGKPGMRDFKTSSKRPEYYDRTINPNDQFTGYMVGASRLANEHCGIALVNVLFNTKTSGPKIQEFILTKTESELQQWEREQVIIEQMISVCREADIWPMEEKTCPFCAFRSVCKMGTEGAQMSKMESEFRQRAWDYKHLEDLDD